VADIAVVNASPVIFLARSGHLDLLSRFFGKIMIPREVAEEINFRGPTDPTVKAMQKAPWLAITDVAGIPPLIASWGLGRGESAVLALAATTEGAEVVMDDMAGRRCASALGIRVRGTLGLVLLAKKRGHIPAARPVVEDLLQGGMYLSRQILDEALSRVDE